MFSLPNPFLTKSAPAAPIPTTDDIQTSETYLQYGKRLCGHTFASDFSLRAFIHKIFHTVKKAQISDPLLGEALAASLTQQIADNDSNIACLENTLQANKQHTGQLRQGVADLKEKIVNLVPDSKATMKFRLCGCILLLLSAFLFFFYSSTFYSAFFRDFLNTGTNTASQAMFDPEAFALSWQAGVMQFLFICLAPFIFMALGLVLHFFFEGKGLAGYFKSAAVITVTLTFDILLAYKIEYNLAYAEWMRTNVNPEILFQHTFLESLTDKDFWVVIFCGFVVYIIWGLLFNTAYTAYIDATSSQRPRRILEEKIEKKETEIRETELHNLELRNKITRLEAENKTLHHRLETHSLWDPAKVRVCLMDFFAGWISVMPALGKTAADQQSAKETFDHELAVLFPQPATSSINP